MPHTRSLLPGLALTLLTLAAPAAGQVPGRDTLTQEILISDPLRTPVSVQPGDTVRAARLPLAAVSTMTGLLAARTPSLVVRSSSGTLGAGSRIYLRGISAVNYRFGPLLVVDGVRYVSEPGALLQSVGGQTPSRIDDLDPEEVESVVVLPGPAGAAKYGPEGATGVLEVRTRRGTGTGVRVHGFVETGVRGDPGGYPVTWSRAGTLSSGGTTQYCTLSAERQGVCTPVAGSLRSLNRLDGALREGLHRRARVAAEAGGRWGGVRLAADAGRSEGVQTDEGWQRRRFHLSARVQPLASLEVEGALHRTDDEIDLPHGDNSIFGYQHRALYTGAADTTSPPPHLPPVSQQAGHGTAFARVEWTARPWLRLGARAGLDRSTRDELFEVGPPLVTTASRGEGEDEWTRRTTALFARAEQVLFDRADWSGTLELERWSDRRRELERFTAGGATSSAVRTRHERSLGVSLAQTLDAGRVGGSLVLRRDAGEEEDARNWSGSLGGYGHPFTGGPLETMRLRAAYGWTRRPLPVDFLPRCEPLGCEQRQQGARGREAEGGMDVEAGGARLSLTGYRRTATEPVWALSSASGHFTMRNTGVEAALRGLLLRGERLEWSAELLAWANQSRVTALDGGPIAFNQGTQTIRAGQPLGAYYGFRLEGFEDRDEDGRISGSGCPSGPACEVSLGDSAVYLGSPLPSHGVVLGSRLRLGGRLAIDARVEHQGGNRMLNRTAQLQCRILSTCRAVLDPAAPLRDQAAVVAAGRGVFEGFLEDGGFTRLRELAVTVSAPAGLAARLGARQLELVLAGRNLATLAGYSGADPEVNFTGGADPLASGDLFTQPNPRVWTVRLDVRY